MILVFAPHPVLERVALVDKFVPGEGQKPMKVTPYAGGAALRAASVVRLLGGDVLAVGSAGGQIGALLGDCLDRQDIPHVLVQASGETPGGFLLLDKEKGVVTEIPETPLSLSPAETEKMLALFERHVSGARFAILADREEEGGGGAELFRGALARATAAGVPVLADVQGTAIGAAADGGAWFLRTNLKALQKETEQSLQHDSAIITEASVLRARGAANVCVTLGEEGALLLTPEAVWRIQPPIVSHFNPTGSGETLVGAVAAFLHRNQDNTGAQEALVTAVRYGCAAASVNVTHDEPGHATPGETNVLWPRTLVQRVQIGAELGAAFEA